MVAGMVSGYGFVSSLRFWGAIACQLVLIYYLKPFALTRGLGCGTEC